MYSTYVRTYTYNPVFLPAFHILFTTIDAAKATLVIYDIVHVGNFPVVCTECITYMCTKFGDVHTSLHVKPLLWPSARNCVVCFLHL